MSIEELKDYDPVGDHAIVAIKYKINEFSAQFYVGGRVGKSDDKQVITSIVRNDYSFYRFGILSYVIYVGDEKPWKEVTVKEVELTFDTKE